MRSMSLVDRWLSLSTQGGRVATLATSATFVGDPGPSVDLAVAPGLRHDATSLRPAAQSAPMSRLVAGELRHQHPRTSPIFKSLSQMSQRRSTGAATFDLVGTKWGDDAEEHAAIIEHDGKIPRDWAEGFARLDPDLPPGDVLLRRWQRFVNDVGLFLDGPFCSVAASLGWTAYDLFGCDRDRPFARLDQQGLLWLLDGCKLVALSENTTTIEMRTGARQTYRRQQSAMGCARAWELAP